MRWYLWLLIAGAVGWAVLCWVCLRLGALRDRDVYEREDIFARYTRHVMLCPDCRPRQGIRCPDGEALLHQATFRFSCRHRRDLLGTEASRTLYHEITGKEATW